MERLYLIFVGALISFGLDAFPCSKYVLDFEGRVINQKLKISWSINMGFNNCGFAKDEILKHKFIIRIENAFEELVLRDTIDQPYFVVSKELIDNNLALIFNIEELGNSRHSYNFLINPQKETIPQLHSKIDTLNFYLLNGYLYNASALLDALKKSDLLDKIITEYQILFPDHYPKEQTYFNYYLEGNSMNLVKMPNVNGLSEFLKKINEMTKNEPTKTKGFKVFAKISSDGKLNEYEVIPESDKKTFDNAVHLLTFSNNISELNNVVIIVGRSKNGKKFTIANKRALIDQRSQYFRTRFPYREAVH